MAAPKAGVRVVAGVVAAAGVVAVNVKAKASVNAWTSTACRRQPTQRREAPKVQWPDRATTRHGRNSGPTAARARESVVAAAVEVSVRTPEANVRLAPSVARIAEASGMTRWKHARNGNAPQRDANRAKTATHATTNGVNGAHNGIKTLQRRPRRTRCQSPRPWQWRTTRPWRLG